MGIEAASATSLTSTFEVDAVRRQFPILDEQVYGHRLAYLDNAATTQKPARVINRLAEYYRRDNSNVHRGVHFLSQKATDAFEASRKRIADYIGANESAEVIFTSGTTDAINLVSATLSQRIGEKDRILVTELEHHSNIVPWQMLCERTGATLDVVPVLDSGELDMDAFAKLITFGPTLVAVGHTSNSLGTINDVKHIVHDSHQHGALVLVDGAQAMAHERINVRELGCDFFCLSGHKMFGPTGVGVLYGKRSVLETLPPYRGGGDMIDRVSFSGTTFAELPSRLEAGTPNIAGVIGLGEAVAFLNDIDLDAAHLHEQSLLDACTNALVNMGGVTIVGTARNKASVVSFNIDGVHPYDTGTILDRLGVAVRTGHHCTMPLMERLGLPGTVRASIALYNNADDIDQFVSAVEKAKQMLL